MSYQPERFSIQMLAKRWNEPESYVEECIRSYQFKSVMLVSKANSLRKLPEACIFWFDPQSWPFELPKAKPKAKKSTTYRGTPVERLRVEKYRTKNGVGYMLWDPSERPEGFNWHNDQFEVLVPREAVESFERKYPTKNGRSADEDNQARKEKFVSAKKNIKRTPMEFSEIPKRPSFAQSEVGEIVGLSERRIYDLHNEGKLTEEDFTTDRRVTRAAVIRLWIRRNGNPPKDS